MKTLDELLIAWRDGSITAAELKELEKLLAEPGARERLFDEFLMSATIAEALKVDVSPQERKEPKQPRQVGRSIWRSSLWAAAAAILLAAGVIYLLSKSQRPSGFQIVAGSAIVDQKRNGPISDKSVVECEGDVPVTIRFPDGSTMELAPSGVTVLQERNVELKAGKAGFQIQKSRAGAKTFSVTAAKGSLTADEAKFSVELQPKKQNTGGAEMRSAIVMAVAVFAGSVSVNYDGANHVLAMGQTQAFGAEDAPAVADNSAPKLPDALKGYTGGLNGIIVSVGTDSIVLKLGPSSKKETADLKDKEVTIVTKDTKNLPQLSAGDKVVVIVSEADGQLTAKTVYPPMKPKP
jgi:ferric-dicitrate binding protein FerR (iron transport regulator)